MKIATVFFVLIFSQVCFSADQNPVEKIMCADDDTLVSYEVSKLSPFGTAPSGLSKELEEQLNNSVCDFYGVYQESWSATCFENSAIATLKSGDSITGFYMDGYEHGSLTVTESKTMSCTVL